MQHEKVFIYSKDIVNKLSKDINKKMYLPKDVKEFKRLRHLEEKATNITENNSINSNENKSNKTIEDIITNKTLEIQSEGFLKQTVKNSTQISDSIIETKNK